MNSNYIFIIGMPGCGKTYFGKALASYLGLNFCDLDELLVGEHVTSISELWQSKGEKEFRILERFTLLKHLCQQEKVMSLGGGSPAHFDQMHLLLEYGIVIYLQASIELLTLRLSQDTSRPMFNDLSGLEQKLNSIYNERIGFFERAHLILQAEDDELYRLKCVKSFVQNFC